jgi:transposase-like protein
MCVCDASPEASTRRSQRENVTSIVSLRDATDKLVNLFETPIQRVIYTTNLIESVNARLRKVICNCG